MIGFNITPEQTTGHDGFDVDTAAIPRDREITSCNDPGPTAIQEHNEISCVDADTFAVPEENTTIGEQFILFVLQICRRRKALEHRIILLAWP